MNYFLISGLVFNTVGSIILAFSINRTTKMLSTSITALELFKDTFLDGGNIHSIEGLDMQRKKALKNTKKRTTIGLILLIIGFLLQLTSLTIDKACIFADKITDSVNCNKFSGTAIDSVSNNNKPKTVTDADGNIYNTLVIGTQIWMVENLKVSHYRNGDPIPNITDPTEWHNLTSGAYCYFNNTPSISKTYGNLYNWYSVNDKRNIAPKGWHVPTDGDWTKLINYLGGDIMAGNKMKEPGTTHWQSQNKEVNNSSGFNALPSGDLVEYNFLGVGLWCSWWSSSETDQYNAWNRIINYNKVGVTRGSGNKVNGLSVRCLKD